MNREVLHKAIYVHFQKRKLLSPSPGPFFPWSFTLTVARYSRQVRVCFFFFFCIAFLSNEFHKRRRETSLPHTVSHKCLKSLFYCTQLRFYHVKLLDTLEEDCQMLWFINPVVDWDDEEDKILELERSFSGVFNTFVNQWCVKKR